jgi:predicted ATP-grasp superfamily ATP-dependent carboligase
MYFRGAHPASDSVFDYDNIVVQEFVPGEIHDVCLLFNHGELRAALTQRRLRQYPAAGGVGVYCETTIEPDLIARAVSLMAKLEWHGPAQVEFKVDRTNGRAWLLEVNGRLWGTLDLAVQAGIDFPWLLYCMAREGDVAPVHHYQTGLRYRWPVPLGWLHSLECGDFAKAMWELFGPSRGSRSDIMIGDPLPPIAEMADVVRRAWARRSIRPARRVG